MVIFPKKYYGYLVITLIALIIGYTSFYLHDPKTPVYMDNWGFKYNDIVYGVFYPRFGIHLLRNRNELVNTWYNIDMYEKLVTREKTYPIPYIDYKFEYPPIIGLLWYFSTTYSIMVNLPMEYNIYLYNGVFDDIIYTHYMVNAVILLASLIIAANTILYFTGKLWKSILFLLLPSTILYTTYNWDILCIMFLLVGLFFLHRKKYILSGIFTGLSVSTKLLPLIALLYLSFILFKKYWRKNREIFYIFTISSWTAALLPYLIVFLLSPRGFNDFLQHHSSWYCENCIYMVIEPEIFSSIHKTLATAFLTVFSIIVLYIYHRRKPDTITFNDYLDIVFIAILVSTVMNYVFSPQMILLISPLALIVLDKRYKIILYILSDIANALIMLFFFIDRDLRILLNKYGLPLKIEFNPWNITSPTQWMAMVRNYILLFILIITIYRVFKKLNGKTSSP